MKIFGVVQHNPKIWPLFEQSLKMIIDYSQILDKHLHDFIIYIFFILQRKHYFELLID